MKLHILYMLFGGDEKEDVVRFDPAVAVGDVELVLVFDGYDVVNLVFVGQFGQAEVYQAGVASYLQSYKTSAPLSSSRYCLVQGRSRAVTISSAASFSW